MSRKPPVARTNGSTWSRRDHFVPRKSLGLKRCDLSQFGFFHLFFFFSCLLPESPGVVWWYFAVLIYSLEALAPCTQQNYTRQLYTCRMRESRNLQNESKVRRIKTETRDPKYTPSDFVSCFKERLLSSRCFFLCFSGSKIERRNAPSNPVR